MRINIQALSVSAIITFILLVITVIFAELNESFKELLTNLTFHHWITKSVFVVISYIVFYLITQFFIKEKNSSKHKFIYTLIIFAILSYLVILGFFTYEFLIKA